MIIIGITGTLGAGKGTVVDYLVANKGFVHYSVRGFLIEELERLNLPINRDGMTLVANELRQKHSPGYIVESLFERARLLEKDCIIESIRNVGEIESLRNRGTFYLLAVDANPITRYDRIVMRNSETDHITFEEFIANEQREMESTDNTKQNISKCVDLADFRLMNDGSVNDLNNKIEELLNGIK